MTGAATRSDQQSGTAARELSLRFLLLLGVPALGVTFAVTVVSSYAPLLLGAHSTPIVIGLIVGAEGLFGIVVPLFATRRLSTANTVRQRIRPMLWVTPVAAAGLVGLGVFSGSAAAVAGGAAVYFFAHFVYLIAYQALYADVVPDEQSGRSRSAESVWRLIGAGAALIAGGFLIQAMRASPFLVAAVLIVAGTVVLHRATASMRDRKLPAQEDPHSAAATLSDMRRLMRKQPVRLIVLANALWHFTLAGLRAFVVLFFVAGLGRSPSFVSGVIFPIVAIGLAIAAPLAGKIADKWGHARVLLVAIPLYGGGLLLPGFSHAAWIVGIVPVVSGSAATVMTIPYALLMTLMPESQHGEASALFTISRGVGGFIGPLVVGVAIEILRGPFASTHGYAAMWPVIGLVTLATVPLLWRLQQSTDHPAKSAG